MAGESFEPELVAAIADRPLLWALSMLDELAEADLIRPSAAPRRFRFRHPIVRTVAYGALPNGWRIGGHARAAAAFAADHTPAVVYAHHIERSARTGDEEAIALLVAAGRAAAPRAPLTAGRWLRAACRLLTSETARDRRVALLCESAAAFAAAGAYDDALAALEDALALLPREDVAERAQLIVKIADVKQHSVRRFESQTLLRQALRSSPAPDRTTTLALQVALAHDHFWRGEFSEMGRVARAVWTHGCGRPTPTVILAQVLDSLAEFYLARVDDARATLAHAEAALAALPDALLAHGPSRRSPRRRTGWGTSIARSSVRGRPSRVPSGPPNRFSSPCRKSSWPAPGLPVATPRARGRSWLPWTSKGRGG
ncbi:MAG TPA: hypothetical protein VG371_02460 [Solirubrobacteraceae bacterium]|nr:hypothetical protein [Solirubrobacteraceae bacterium]